MRSGAGAWRAILHLGLVCLRVGDEVRQMCRRDTGRARSGSAAAARPAPPARNRSRRRRRRPCAGAALGRWAIRRRTEADNRRDRRATIRVAPVMPPAPGTFSTMTCWPRPSERACGIDAPQRVVHAARRERHHHGHRPGRPILRLRRRMRRTQRRTMPRQSTQPTIDALPHAPAIAPSAARTAARCR